MFSTIAWRNSPYSRNSSDYVVEGGGAPGFHVFPTKRAAVEAAKRHLEHGVATPHTSLRRPCGLPRRRTCLSALVERALASFPQMTC